MEEDEEEGWRLAEEAQQEDETEKEPESHDIVATDALFVVLTTLVALAGVYLFPLDAGHIRNLTFSPLLSFQSLTALLIVLPAAFTASISMERFRREAWFSLIALPAALLGGTMIVAAVAIPAAVMYIAHKSHTRYNGRNSSHVFYQAGGTFILAFALVAALLLGGSVYADQGFRSDLQNATARTIASQTASLAGMATSGVKQKMEDRTRKLAKSIGRNAATLAIVQTRKDVVGSMSGIDSFQSGEQRALQQSFAAAQASVPDRVVANMTQNLDERLDTAGLAGDVEGAVRPEVSSVIDPLFERSEALAAGLFIVSFSLIYALRLPFRLVTLLFGSVIFLSRN